MYFMHDVSELMYVKKILIASKIIYIFINYKPMPDKRKEKKKYGIVENYHFLVQNKFLKNTPIRGGQYFNMIMIMNNAVINSQ